MTKITTGKPQRLILMQLLATILIALLLLPIKGVTVAASAFIGGAIGFLPAWLYIRTMMAGREADPQDLLRAQYKAEFYKFAVTVAMFAAVFSFFRDVAALYLFVAYFVALSMYWVAIVID
jgi:ATP synthase protein I